MLKDSFDIVVGISTKNCADTIVGVINTVDRGLKEFFPGKRSLIVVSDGFSTDGTREKAQGLKTNTRVLVTQQSGGLGKGNGVRTILEIARKSGAAAVALIDGDLTSIQPDWIVRLAGPVLEGRDLIVPYYLRHHYDGVITNQITFPLTNVLFGIGVRQPIGGEYGISTNLLEHLLQHELFPEGFGIDIFITLVAVSEKMKIAEAVLGIKEHESTKQYAEPDRLLVPMFYQVVGTLFRLINHYRSHIETVHEIRPVERLGEKPDMRPVEVTVDQGDLLRRFKADYERLARKNGGIIHGLKGDLDRIASSELADYSFPLSLWVRAVYLAINAFSDADEPKVLDALRILWQGRFLGLVRETEAMGSEEAEAYIQGQLAEFERRRSLLNLRGGKQGDLRADLDRIIQAVLTAVAPELCLRRAVRVEGDRLNVAGESYELSQIERVIVVGMGKASARMAAALEEILGERITTGLVVTADGYEASTEKIEIAPAAHPIPDVRGLKATKRIATLVDAADERDLVIVLISGGGSALLSLPATGLELSDITATNELLLHSGATIKEVNTVRKHLSQLKGGQLARRAFPAQVITFILSDVAGDPIDSIASGPTVGDPTTFNDAAEILNRYQLWSDLPGPVRERIEAGTIGQLVETPKPGDPLFERVTAVIVGSGTVAGEAALKEGRRLGYNTLLLTTTLEGEAREVGRVFAALAREEASHERPLPLPALLLAAGETTVTVRGAGKGGRNQELALSAAIGIEGLKNTVIASLGTDGRDGPTDAAGGMVDGGTIWRMREQGIDPDKSLTQNDSYHALLQAGDLIVTGPTGTNVADLCFVVVGNKGG
jgi:hydroxypyruvate reductase